MDLQVHYESVVCRALSVYVCVYVAQSAGSSCAPDPLCKLSHTHAHTHTQVGGASISDGQLLRVYYGHLYMGSLLWAGVYRQPIT